MPVLNLNVTITDADYARLMTAAKAALADQLGANPPDAAVVEALRQYGIDQMRQLVRNYERAVAIRTAEALEPTIEVS